MKKQKIIFWTTTIIIFIFEGVIPALTSQTDVAKEGIRHLGYPDYFGILLTLFKVAGSVGLIFARGRVREWVYAGFGFDFTFALLSLVIVDGITPLVILPLVCMILLVLSYRSYTKIQTLKRAV